MARSFLFECSRCRYRAVVVGGEDRAAHCFVQTVQCHECRQLFDVPVRLRVGLDAVQLRQRLNRRLFPGRPLELDRPAPGWNLRLARVPQAARWATVKLRCPSIPWHRVQPWNQPGPCPRCGDPLEGTLVPWRAWD
jgi:hypothetical protein